MRSFTPLPALLSTGKFQEWIRLRVSEFFFQKLFSKFLLYMIYLDYRTLKTTDYPGFINSNWYIPLPTCLLHILEHLQQVLYKGGVHSALYLLHSHT